MYDASPPPGGSTYDYADSVQQCCGHLVHVFAGDGGCNDESLRSAEARKSLSLLADAGNQVMVKDCKGHFRVYNAQPFNPMSTAEGIHIHLDSSSSTS